MQKEHAFALLRAEVLPTIGCTEPGAVALAAAYASRLLLGKIQRIDISVNANIYKNGVAVGIPGTGETGLHIAAALGAIKKNPEKELSTLEEVSDAEVNEARRMISNDLVHVNVDNTRTALWVQVAVVTEAGKSEALICEQHTRLSRLICNDEVLFELGSTDAHTDAHDESGAHRFILSGDDMRVADIIKTVEAIPAVELEFLLEGAAMNVAAAEAGLRRSMGMGVGAAISELVETGSMTNDMVTEAKMMAAAAADARMSGESIPVMSSAGSGNHGITAILPVCVVAKREHVPSDRLVKALAISHLITIYVKIYTGKLSALCGCSVAAATGATAAITWMLDGTVRQTEAAMKNIIANLTGMICDGGKVGCALKLSTAASAAVESALLAKRDIEVPATNGIITDSIEQTVKNLGRVSAPGMLETDKVIMNVMLEKEGQKQLCSMSSGRMP